MVFSLLFFFGKRNLVKLIDILYTYIEHEQKNNIIN